MDNNKNFIAAVGLMFGVWLLFTLIFPPTKQQPPVPGSEAEQQIEQQVAAAPAADSAPASRSAEPIAAVPEAPVSEREIVVQTDLYRAVLTNVGARLKNFQLAEYRVAADEDADPVHVVDVQSPRLATLSLEGNNGVSIGSEASYSVSGSETSIELQGGDVRPVVFRAKTSTGAVIEKTYTFRGDSYAVDVEVKVSNPGNDILAGEMSLALLQPWDDSQEVDRFSFVGAATLVGDSLETISVDDLKEKAPSYPKGAVWTAFETKYFMSALVPLEIKDAKAKVSRDDDIIRNIINLPYIKLEPGQSTSFNFLTYFGPREVEVLKQINYDLARAIDFGFFSPIADPLLWFLNFIYGYINNYGIAIILLTVIIKILFWPLTHKSYASMKAMQKLQPEIQKIKERFKNDRARQGQETMELYKKNRVNPMSGCLPMLVQIPVFFALYRVLYEAIELRHAPFMLWVTDLSAPDTLFSDALGLGFALGPLPLIMGLTMFIQQKMTPTTGDPNVARMMMMMPIVFTFLFLGFPSGLVIYWLINNVLTIAQQFYIHRTFS